MTHRLTQVHTYEDGLRASNVTVQDGTAAKARADRILRLKAAGTPYMVTTPSGDLAVEFDDEVAGFRDDPGFTRHVRLTWEDDQP